MIKKQGSEMCPFKQHTNMTTITLENGNKAESPDFDKEIAIEVRDTGCQTIWLTKGDLIKCLALFDAP